MAEFSSNEKMLKIPELLQELLEHVLYDEEPLFISDEATIWEVSMATQEETIKRCSEYYGIPVSMEDLRQPLWKLLPKLDTARRRR